MHEFLSERPGQLQRLATTIRTGLDQAESAIPSINQQLAELARLGMSDFQIEGPTIYCRPMGFSGVAGIPPVIKPDTAKHQQKPKFTGNRCHY